MMIGDLPETEVDMIPNVRYVKFNTRRKFGVELEFSNKTAQAVIAKIVGDNDSKHRTTVSGSYVGSAIGGTGDYNNNYWHVKFDRSCGEEKNQGGWEVASYVAKGYKDLTSIGKVAKALHEGGAKVNNNCALHVHGEMSDFDLDHAVKVIALWMKIEEVVCEACPKHRRNNTYCRMLTRKFVTDPEKKYTPAALWAAVRPRDYGNNDRRVTLNYCNYAQGAKRTFELRLPEGTSDPKDVKNWIRFYIHFIDTCKEVEFPDKIQPVNLTDTLKIAGLHGEEPFLILSKALRQTKAWFLQRVMKFTTKRKLREEAAHLLSTMQMTPVVAVEQSSPETKKNYSFFRALLGESYSRGNDRYTDDYDD